MILFFKFFIISCLIIFGSCFSTTGIFLNPCKSSNFLSNLEKINKKELAKIELDLKNIIYSNTNSEGCQAALLARINLANNNLTKASSYFSIAAKKLPELGDYFILAKAFTELKNYNYLQAKILATALLDSHTAPGSTHFRMRIMQVLADVALKEKDHQQIIRTHQELLKHGYGDQAALLFNLGTFLGIMGEHQKAESIFKKLLVKFPSSNQAQETHKLKNLSKIFFNIKENEVRYNKLIENLAFDRVVSDVNKEIKKSKNIHDISMLHGFAIKALMLNNQFEKALSRAQALANQHFATSKDFENYAWSLGKVDRFIKAADYYTRMADNSPDQATKARGCFFAGFSLYEASLYSLAQLSWQRCESSMQQGSYHENYLWYQALSALLTNDNKSAHALLLNLSNTFKKSPDLDKYSYFLGYALLQDLKKKPAEEVWLKLARINKPTYYVLLARQSLGLHAPLGKAISANTECKNKPCEKALMLLNLGFKEEARDLVLASIMPAEQKNYLLQSLGFYHEAWQRSNSVATELSIKNNYLVADAKIRSSYPLPHENIVNTMSRKYSVPKSLLYAIIRAESGFLSDAKSYRGALGLMQIMPFVAHDLASKLCLDKFSLERLSEPKVSIELGALLLATHQRQFGKQHLVIAAYNAGPHQVQKWLNRFGDLPVELFIERVPFQETRNYLKKVREGQSLYAALEGQALKLEP